MRELYEEGKAIDQKHEQLYRRLTPEMRTLFERWRNEDAPEDELLQELERGLLEGGISPEDFELWTVEIEREANSRFWRRLGLEGTGGEE
jgi:hypothetical protein